MSRYIVASIALLLFLASLALPAFDLQQGDDSYYLGFIVLLFGGLTFDPRWLANPLWLAGVVCLLFRFRLASLLILSTASLLALLCMTFVGTLIAQNASGTETTIVEMGLGYYVWLCSIIVPAVYAMYAFLVPPHMASQGRLVPRALSQ